MRLKRPCKRCGEYFRPTGKGSWICPRCIKPKGWLAKTGWTKKI